MKKVGVIGCGVIAEIYVNDFQECYSDRIEVVACQDIVDGKAAEFARKFNIPHACGTIEELLEIDEIDIVMNLTIPSVHTEINKMILNAGKHVYCEKPLGCSLEEAKETIALAKEKGLRVTCAPDTLLGASMQTCRKLIDDNVIGDVFAIAVNITGYGPETWHPNPHFLYQKGAGPTMDMAPYAMASLVNFFGPMEKLQCMSCKPFDKRYIYSMPHRGEYMDVEVDTVYAANAVMRSGIVVNMNMTFDYWKDSLPCFEIYGTQGTLSIPHPADFKGEIKFFRANGIIDSLEDRGVLEDKDEWHTLPLMYTGSIGNPRGIGVVDMAAALDNGRDPRLNEEFCLHCLEICLAFEKASASGETYHFETSCVRPAPMPLSLNVACTD